MFKQDLWPGMQLNSVFCVNHGKETEIRDFSRNIWHLGSFHFYLRQHWRQHVVSTGTIHRHTHEEHITDTIIYMIK